MFALALDGDRANLQYLLDYAQAYVDLGQFEKARGFFLAAIEREPYAPLANYRLANLYKFFGQTDDAILLYGSALASNPGFAEAYNNRGGAFQVLGRTLEAIADFRRAIELKPGLEQAYLNLGRLLDTGGDFDGAALVYKQAIQAGLSEGLFSHLLDSVTKAESHKAPVGYLRSIFDDYAPSFDLHLTQGLGYQLPAHIGAIVKAESVGRQSKLIVLDAGCGTGLCGAEIADCVEHLGGVDVSPAMLEQADRRGVYHDLVEADIERYLPEIAEESLDVLIAADVFIYVGYLERIFSEVRRILKHEGLFIFSIELLDTGAGYQLQRTGRFQHAKAYVEQLAANSGLTVEQCESINVRLERALPVAGCLYVMRRAA